MWSITAKRDYGGQMQYLCVNGTARAWCGVAEVYEYAAEYGKPDNAVLRIDGVVQGKSGHPIPCVSGASTTRSAVTTPEKTYLYCADKPVYCVGTSEILDRARLPGAMLAGLPFFEWMRTRYSATPNIVARQLFLKAMGESNHETPKVVKLSRALCLSDSYWVGSERDKGSFIRLTPYLNKEWDGSESYKGGSIATLFTGGVRGKRWFNAEWLHKYTLGGQDVSVEYEAYQLCKRLNIPVNEVCLLPDSKGVAVKNFTNTRVFMETAEQSFQFRKGSLHQTALTYFGDLAVQMWVLDYLISNCDRHWGNFGFMRSVETGAYLGMAPLFDFDWAFGRQATLPALVLNHKDIVRRMCESRVWRGLPHGDYVSQRAVELLAYLKGTALPVEDTENY
ncbi:hypothetical protein FACS1894208_00680 [Clostridia bacterium]|nr:hypothetical protein FACS1894208_00680 [Clostridia bacterium]